MRRAIRQERAARETAFGLVPRRTQSAWTGECPLPWRRGPHRDAHLMGQSAQIIYSCARLNSSNGHERHLRLIFFLKFPELFRPELARKWNGPMDRQREISSNLPMKDKWQKEWPLISGQSDANPLHGCVQWPEANCLAAATCALSFDIFSFIPQRDGGKRFVINNSN